MAGHDLAYNTSATCTYVQPPLSSLRGLVNEWRVMTLQVPATQQPPLSLCGLVNEFVKY